MGRSNDLSRNGSGYYDPTAYQAIKDVMADELKELKESDRFHHPDNFKSELSTNRNENDI